MSEHENQTEEMNLPEDRLTGHNYDGIQEYDNPTPAWWTWIFFASVGFAAVYMSVTLLALGGLSPEAELDRAILANQQRMFGDMEEMEPTEEYILTMMQEERWLTLGRGVYATHCTSCHGSDAKGSTSAPNLTDEHYLHVSTLADIADVILVGRGNGKMPGWSQLSPNEIVVLSSYIASLRGTSTDGKGPEGEIPPPWPEATEAPADPAEQPAESEATG